MKNLTSLKVSALKVEEMFNVRGGDGNDVGTTTASSKNTTAQGEDEDIIL